MKPTFKGVNMDKEKALYLLWDIRSNMLNDECYLEYRDAIREAIRSLEKDIPNDVIYSNFDDNGFDEIIPYKAECPVCGYEFEFGTWNEEENHHCVCGQKLKWNRTD